MNNPNAHVISTLATVGINDGVQMKVEIQAHPNLASYISLDLNMAANLKTGFLLVPNPFSCGAKNGGHDEAMMSASRG